MQMKYLNILIKQLSQLKSRTMRKQQKQVRIRSLLKRKQKCEKQKQNRLLSWPLFQLVSQLALLSLQVSQSLLVSRLASLLVNRSANQFPLVTQLLSAGLYLLVVLSWLASQ